MVQDHRRPAAAIARLDSWLRRELRLVDSRADGVDQPDSLPAEPQERGVDAEDAGDSARDEGDPGALREAEGHGSRTSENEPGVDGAVSRARRQSGKRMRADPADASRVPGVLFAPDDGNSAARCALHWLDPRPVATRPVLRDARARGHLADRDAMDDAASRGRSDAAEDDDDHADRADLRLHLD